MGESHGLIAVMKITFHEIVQALLLKIRANGALRQPVEIACHVELDAVTV